MDVAGRQLGEYIKLYRKTHAPIRVNFRSLCSQWDWAKRSDVYTHLMHRYPAKILPYIPIFFLSTEKYASKDDIVMDCFCGTGTVLLESLINPYFKRNCVGVEINPIARLIAKVKTTPLDTDELEKKADELIKKIIGFRGRPHIPHFLNINYWFSVNVQQDLAKIHTCIDEIEESDYKDFFLVCLSSIVREVSYADTKIAPPIRLRPRNFGSNPKLQKEAESALRRKRRAKPFHYFKNAIKFNIERLKQYDKVVSPEVKGHIIWDDARSIRWGELRCNGEIDKSKSEPLKDGSIGLVITSPPYINAQKYIRTTKFELFWTNMMSESEIADVDKRIVGTERVSSNEYREPHFTGVTSADETISCIYQKDPYRAGVVSKYFLDMKEVIKEICRILKPGGLFVLVVGNNKIRGTEVENYKILSDIATKDGKFFIKTILVDEIRSRGMITKRHETGGLVLDEWIVVLKKGC
jgi:DNA modification methylase